MTKSRPHRGNNPNRDTFHMKRSRGADAGGRYALRRTILAPSPRRVHCTRWLGRHRKAGPEAKRFVRGNRGLMMVNDWNSVTYQWTLAARKRKAETCRRRQTSETRQSTGTKSKQLLLLYTRNVPTAERGLVELIGPSSKEEGEVTKTRKRTPPRRLRGN